MSKPIIFKNITLKVEGSVERLTPNAIIVQNKGFSRIVLSSKSKKFTIIIRGD